jgi:hypothetical protein
MNGSARPAYKHYLLYLPPFDLTDRLETRPSANSCTTPDDGEQETDQEVEREETDTSTRSFLAKKT